MPIYEYECRSCGKRFDKMQPVTSDPLTVCALCGGGPLRRVFQPVGVIFKGSGWYVNDNRSGNKEGESNSAHASDSKAATPAKSEESKPSAPPPKAADGSKD